MLCPVEQEVRIIADAADVLRKLDSEVLLLQEVRTTTFASD
jgi:hypothetical protein